ncbi:hypothetical protein [Halobacterium yunchengense]|uniref:hypothetical protein n=1 Tax=Halobacterium yunchengense TaxID=3108497 RepID=UPI00300B22AB
MQSRSAFPTLLAVFAAGLTAPLVVAELFHTSLNLYLAPEEYAYASAFVFGVFAWGVLALRDVDRVEFLTASVVFPLVALFVTLPLIAAAYRHEVQGVQYAFHTVGHALTYAVSFVGAGVAAVAIQRGTERLAVRHSSVPDPRFVPVVVAAVLVLATAAGGAYAQYTASSATVERVESGVHDFDPRPGFHDHAPVLNVTVDGGGTELQLRVTGPNGATHVQRVPASAFRNGSTTVPVRFSRFASFTPAAGVYDVSVQSAAGVTVATASHTIEVGPDPGLTRVPTAAAGESLDVDLPENSVHMRQEQGPEDSHTRVAVVVENGGDAPAWFDAAVMYDEDDGTDARRIVRAGASAGFVFDVPSDVVDRVHETGNGTVTVEVTVGERALTETVELPEE